MKKYVYEAHRYAEEGLQDREREEIYGRLRLALFWSFVGLVAMVVVVATHKMPPRWLAWVIIGTAPVAIIVFVSNYIRLPAISKVNLSALIIGFITLTLAAATMTLTLIFSVLTAR